MRDAIISVLRLKVIPLASFRRRASERLAASVFDRALFDLARRDPVRRVNVGGSFWRRDMKSCSYLRRVFMQRVNINAVISTAVLSTVSTLYITSDIELLKLFRRRLNSD